jgi:hypothetical protein
MHSKSNRSAYLLLAHSIVASCARLETTTMNYLDGWNAESEKNFKIVHGCSTLRVVHVIPFVGSHYSLNA